MLSGRNLLVSLRRLFWLLDLRLLLMVLDHFVYEPELEVLGFFGSLVVLSISYLDLLWLRIGIWQS